ncbi:uncharacterized protein LOC119103662 [Pollicipes pollicipes]|uniref:uncharacterized protein LOC119103662 n=1 Tax=Pollicipes pollicipes TaxID=41117 RepID=UPI001885883E|nr:uncharacterized protein LOC119103662 [Pollicipes pollicipes]
MESETVDKVAKKGYRRHFVKGIRRAHNTEQFIHNKNEHLVRGTTAFSDIVQKDVAVNQTHADSSGMAALTKRTNMKQNMVGAKSKGFAFGFQIHIGGACYSGSANKTKWMGPLTKPDSAFSCLCSCVKENKFFFAIIEGGACFCTNKYGQFGNKTGYITTDGKCHKPGVRAIYNSLNHTHELVKFCGRKLKGSGITEFLQKKDNTGHRFVDFKSSETLLARINSSSLAGTHVNSSDAEVAKTVNRWHKKNGTITTDWKSHLAAGPIKNQFRLRLHVKKLHNFTESLNLTTRQDAVMVHSARGVPFRPPKRPIFH